MPSFAIKCEVISIENTPHLVLMALVYPSLSSPINVHALIGTLVGNTIKPQRLVVDHNPPFARLAINP